VVDEGPQETLLLSLYDVKLRIQEWLESRVERGAAAGNFESVRKIKFQMQHMQLDNMTSMTMPVIFAPTKPLL
jgi:hypothetical protein